MTQPELFTPQTYRDRVAAYLKSRQGQWVSAYDLMDVGGRMGWRTRISNARRQLHMTIENRLRRVRGHEQGCPAMQAWDIPDACQCCGTTYTVSEYRYTEAA